MNLVESPQPLCPHRNRRVRRVKKIPMPSIARRIHNHWRVPITLHMRPSARPHSVSRTQLAPQLTRIPAGIHRHIQPDYPAPSLIRQAAPPRPRSIPANSKAPRPAQSLIRTTPPKPSTKSRGRSSEPRARLLPFLLREAKLDPAYQYTQSVIIQPDYDHACACAERPADSAVPSFCPLSTSVTWLQCNRNPAFTLP